MSEHDSKDDSELWSGPPTKRERTAGSSSARLEPGMRVGRYVILDEIGAGGMGVVYAAHDPELDRRVAIKVLHANTIANDKMWLLREAQALARLSHPNVIAVHDVGSLPDDRVFVAMELVKGETLRGWLENSSRGWREVLAVLRAAGAGLAAAHRAGLVHRDFKPDNTLVGDDGRVRVLDFGLARLGRDSDRDSDVTIEQRSPLGATLTEAGTVIGTPAYLAPELNAGGTADARSDQFAFGVALYEALYRVRPFDKGNTHAPPKEPPDTGVPTSIRGVVLRAIATDPAARFESMDELLAQLTLDRVGARRRAVVAAGVVVLGVSVAVGVGLHSSGPAAPSITSAAIAVAPLAIDMPRYGREPPEPRASADTLALLLGQLSGVRFTGMLAASQDLAAARAQAADYLVRGGIRDDGGTLHADIEIISVRTERPVTTIRASSTSVQLAPLLDMVALEIARRIAPNAQVELEAGVPRAQLLYRRGIDALSLGTFTEARQFLEQAVDADAQLGDAWYSLALAEQWTQAGHGLQQQAIENAVKLAPPAKRELLLGVRAYAEQRWTEGRERLEKLATAAGADNPSPRDVLYFLGETNWHDGRHDAGFAYFKRSLEIDRHFRPAMVHTWQYLVIRRDPEAARYTALADEQNGWADFALGRYEQLPDRGNPPFALWARIVTDRPLTEDDTTWLGGDALDARVLRMAGALGDGDEATARSELAALWRAEVADRDPKGLSIATYHALEQVAELAIAAELRPEARQVVTFLDAQKMPSPTRGYQRLTILAAPLLHDASLIDRERVPERSRRMIEAAEAELAGRREEAAAIWAELVANPTFEWDYPERAILARDLARLRRTRALDALCADTLRPAVFRPAWLVMRRLCSQLRPH